MASRRLQGSFTSNGIPQDGATVNLYTAGAPFTKFPPEFKTPLPVSGLIATTVTGPEAGYPGAYLFEGVDDIPDYYAGINWKGNTHWEFHPRIPSGVIVSVKTYGAKGDGVTDDSNAIRAAIRAAIDTTKARGNASVYFPHGVYRITANAVFSDIEQTSQGGIHFYGDGRNASEIVLDTSEGATHLYDNEPDRRLQFLTFVDLMFRSDPVRTGSGFRQWTDSGGHEQHFTFHRCELREFDVVFECAGTTNASENRWFDCSIRRSNQFMVISNAQAVNHELIGTDVEGILGDIFTIGSGGGGSIHIFGGSFIWGGGGGLSSTADSYFLRATGSNNLGTGNNEISIFGIRAETRSAFGKFVICTENLGTLLVNCHGCNFTGANLGGTREAVRIGLQKHVHFSQCNIPSEWTYHFVTTNSVAAGTAGLITFDQCRIPEDLITKLSRAEGVGRAWARNCTSTLIPTGTVAINFDYNWENDSRGDVGVQLKTAVIKRQVDNWPTGGSNEWVITLPVSATIRNIYVDMPAGGSSTAAYQLHVGNDDKTETYGSSTSAQNKDRHTITVTNLFKNVGQDLNTRRIRIRSDPSGDTARAGGVTLVEYY